MDTLHMVSYIDTYPDGIEAWKDKDGIYYVTPDGAEYRDIEEARCALKRWRESSVPASTGPKP